MSSSKSQVNSFKDFLNLKPNDLFNPAKQELDISYKDAIKGLRYLRSDFDKYDLRKPVANRTKGKVKEVLQEYISLISQPSARIVVPRKKNRKKLLKHTNQGNKWKKAIVPVTTGDEKITYKNGKAVLSGKYGAEFNLDFDLRSLIIDSDKEVDRVLKGIKFDCLYLRCGNHLLNKDELENFAGSVKALKKVIKKLMNKYNAPDENNYFGKWMFGIKIINLKNQDLDCQNWSDVYERKRNAAKKKAKKKRIKT